MRQQLAPSPRPAPQQVRFQPAPQPIHAQEEDRNPFINPHDPTHLNFAHNQNGAKFAPKVAGVLDGSFVPPCAGCEGLNPFVNPFDQSHQNAGFLAGQLEGVQAQQPARRPLPIANARPTGRVVSQPQQTLAFQTQQALLNTIPQQQQQAPARNIFPPGQIQLNRFETGFNFDFQS